MKKKVIAVFFFLIFSFLSVCMGEEKAPDDYLTLSLTKTVLVKEYKGQKIFYEPYTIRKGDWLWRVLKNKYKIPPKQRPTFLAALKKLNPSVNDINVIHPGQKIFIPLKMEADSGQSPQSMSLSSSSSRHVSIVEHTVMPGQSVTSILLNTYKVPKALVFNKYLNHFSQLNPSIKDLNLIKANQKIRVPVYKPVVKEQGESAQESSVKPLMTHEVSTTPGISSITEMKDAEGGNEREKALSFKTASHRRAINDSIGALFENIGDRYINKGNHHIPILGAGELTLDTEEFPVIEMENGRRIIVDIADELPAKVEKLIVSNWKNYRVANIQRDDTIETALNTLFFLSGYNAIYRRAKPLELNSTVNMKIWADWFIFKDGKDVPENRVFALNLISKDDSEVPFAIKKYVEQRGVKVFDMSFDMQRQKELKENTEAVDEQEGIVKLNSSNKEDLTRDLLSLMHQPFTVKRKMDMMAAKSGGFKVEVTADIYFNRNSIDHIISLQSLSRDLEDILAENGFRVLEVDEKEPPTVVISNILDFLGVQGMSRTAEVSTLQKGAPRNITISVPGILIEQDSASSILLTETKLDKNIHYFLEKRGVKAILY